MSKNFKTVSDFISEYAKTCIISIASISFTLLGNVEMANANVPTYSAVDNPVVDERLVPASPHTDIDVKLSFNVEQTETARMMDDAFNDFCKIEPDAKSILLKSFSEIKNGLSTIPAEKVSIDGSIRKMSINVGMLLPDGVVLSINKRNGLHPNEVVGFNIIYNRELLVSDVMDLESLRKYIISVQPSL